MSLRALFRLPGEQRAYRVSADRPVTLRSVADVAGQHGFVIAPFSPCAERPILLLPTQACQPFDLTDEGGGTPGIPPFHVPHAATEEKRYARQFAIYHKELVDGHFQKIVLSRSKRLAFDGTIPQQQFRSLCDHLFQRACRQYPDAFVALAETSTHGAWLTATPEVLLRSTGDGRFHTMALAGTMPFTATPEWSRKNCDEQQYVASFIAENLDVYADDTIQSPTRTVRAGHLAHLCTEFHFSLPSNEAFGRLLQALHPTPAVCGLPKAETYEFLRHHAARDRQYYSGFLGPVGLSMAGGAQEQTSLYVNLRCIQVTPTGITLHAGGGLLAESVERQEFAETESKMETMLRLLR